MTNAKKALRAIAIFFLLFFGFLLLTFSFAIAKKNKEKIKKFFKENWPEMVCGLYFIFEANKKNKKKNPFGDGVSEL